MKEYVVTFNGIECGEDVYEPVVIKPRKTVMKVYGFTLTASYDKGLDGDNFMKLANIIYEVVGDDLTAMHRGESNSLIIEINKEAVSYAKAVDPVVKSLNQIEGLTVKL